MKGIHLHYQRWLHRRVTTTVRQLAFPTESTARTITWLYPTSNGITAVQFVVPAAVPAAPVFVDQVTLATPERSDAVPANVNEDDVVAKDVADGKVMVRVGPVVSVLVGSGVTVRMVLTTRETLPAESAATTVMVFEPTIKGMFAATQFVPLIEAIPDAPVFENQVTVTVPLLPVTVPESDSVADVVVVGGGSTLSVSELPTTRVTPTTREIPPVASVARTVMLLNPMDRGTFAATQLVPLTIAVPKAPVFVDHVTATPPDAPVTVPESAMMAAVVVLGGVSTVSVS